MREATMICAVLGVLAGCGSRPASTTDAAVVGDGKIQRDGAARDAPPTSCTSLAKVGQAALEFADTMKLNPQLAVDGQRLAVVWHSQPGIISSLSGELRLAMLDAVGKTTTPDGIKLASDNGIVQASLVAAGGGELAILHLPLISGTDQGLELRRVDVHGQTLGTTFLKGQFYRAAMTAHPSGYTILRAVQSGSPELVVVNAAGVVSAPRALISAQVMAALWLAPRPGGFAAAFYTTNSIAELFLLDPTFDVVRQLSVGHGALVTAPSYAVLPAGFATLYVSSGAQIVSEVFDAQGQPGGQHQLAIAGSSPPGTRQTALTGNGKQLFAIHPAAVAGQYVVQILDTAGAPAGKAVPLPNCLMTASGVSAVWGNNQLAVATINEASGVAKSSVCVTVMGCL